MPVPWKRSSSATRVPATGNIVVALYHKLNTQSSAPEDGQNNCPKHAELIGIINKPLLLHLFSYLYYLHDAVATTCQVYRLWNRQVRVSAWTFTRTSHFWYLISVPSLKNHATTSSYYSILPNPLQMHGSPNIRLSALQSAIRTTPKPNSTYSEFLSSSSILLSSSSVSNYSAHNSRAVKNLSFNISGENVCYCIKYKKKVSLSLPLPLSLTLTHTHTHTHTHSQAGYVSLKTTLSFRFRVQKLLPDWKRGVFYAHFHSGYMEQETLSNHVPLFNFGSITTALRASLHCTPIRRCVAGCSHSKKRPALPDLLLTAHFNNRDIQAAV